MTDFTQYKDINLLLLLLISFYCYFFLVEIQVVRGQGWQKIILISQFFRKSPRIQIIFVNTFGLKSTAIKATMLYYF